MLIQETLSNWPVKLRGVLGAGEPLNPEVIEQVKNAWGLTIRDGFGQTETTCAIGNSPGETIKFGSMGKPMPGYPVVLLDVEGQVSDEGEICFDLSKRPMGLMDSYFGDVEKTADAMRDGFYHTCDVASRDKDGYITYVGRSDDVFKSSDYRLSPFELESVLMTHPDIAETAVIPSPDSKRLNVPKAFIVLRSGVLPDRNVALSILRFAREHLAPYKRVRRIEFAELPKTISGKIRRSELRTLENEKIKTNVRDANEYWEEDFPDLLT
jgi:acetyl-CoA synthetase